MCFFFFSAVTKGTGQNRDSTVVSLVLGPGVARPDPDPRLTPEVVSGDAPVDGGVVVVGLQDALPVVEGRGAAAQQDDVVAPTLALGVTENNNKKKNSTRVSRLRRHESKRQRSIVR